MMLLYSSLALKKWKRELGMKGLNHSGYVAWGSLRPEEQKRISVVIASFIASGDKSLKRRLNGVLY